MMHGGFPSDAGFGLFLLLATAGCSSTEVRPDDDPVGAPTVPLVFITGRSGAEQVILQAADSLEEPRLLGGFVLAFKRGPPFEEHDYTTQGDYINLRHSTVTSPDGKHVVFFTTTSSRS